jgi:predicted DNA-binding transcriptional regulator YafY
MTDAADIITSAIRAERVVRFWFVTKSRPVPMIRTVSPYELSDDSESFLGFDHDRQAIRRFNLDGIADTEGIELPDEDYIQPVEQS